MLKIVRYVGWSVRGGRVAHGPLLSNKPEIATGGSSFAALRNTAKLDVTVTDNPMQLSWALWTETAVAKKFTLQLYLLFGKNLL